MSRSWAVALAWSVVVIAFVARTVALLIEGIALGDPIGYNLLWGLPAWVIVTIGGVVR